MVPDINHLQKKYEFCVKGIELDNILLLLPHRTSDCVNKSELSTFACCIDLVKSTLLIDNTKCCTYCMHPYHCMLGVCLYYCNTL